MEFASQQADLQAMISAGEFLPLLMLRGGQLQVVSADLSWEPGDRLIYLMHMPRLELVTSVQNPVAALGELSLQTLNRLETVPENP